ncbi:MAG: hypothetical protein IPO40_14020 [Fibrobacteres bacterium]|nr:hypothetical protein [Fibrobacterota bacterium]
MAIRFPCAQAVQAEWSWSVRVWFSSFFLLLCGCMAAHSVSNRSETPLIAIPEIPDPKFWSQDDWITPLENDLAKNLHRARWILAPKHIDRRTAPSIPLNIVQSGPFDEFEYGNFAEEGFAVLVDMDRGSIGLGPISPKTDAARKPRKKGPRQPGAAIHTVQTSGLDLASRFFPDFARTTGRFKVRGILPLAATASVEIDVGADPSAFPKDLSAALATIPERTSLPPELLQASPPWKALAAPPSLDEGLRGTLSTESGHAFLEVDFALPELRGERLHLEPGAVLPSGNRPPDAVKWIHILAAGEDSMLPIHLLLPVVASADDALLRGHAKIDLGRLLPGSANGDFQSVYVFSGAESVGPLELPARKH